MRTALDDIKFLVNSPYRVTVLSHLAGSPADRPTLHEATEIPQSTLGRILAGFQERGWIEHDGTEYRITPNGRQLATDFADLESNVERAQKRQLIDEWLPDGLDVDLDAFDDAEIVTPVPADPLRPVRHHLATLRRATSIRGIAPSVVPEALEALRAGVSEVGLTLELVVTPAVVDVIGGHSDLTAAVRAILESDGGHLFRAEDVVPCVVLVVVGERVVFVFVDDQGRVLGAVGSDSTSVTTWAVELVDDHLQRADRLVAADFTG